MPGTDSIENQIDRAAHLLAGSTRTVVSTGSGISSESGIPTFRGEEGLWNNHRPEELASREGFLADPSLVWRWYRERLLTARDKQPNPGHHALARLESVLPWFLLITQNVDNLHRRAGSREIVELHGNIERYRCLEHSHPATESPDWGDVPPRCHCGSIIRPDVVWFQEPLPAAEIECAFRESSRCDTFLIVGTSGVVQPAATLPHVAKSGGARLIEVNISPSEITPIVDVFLEGRSGMILPMLVELVEKLVSAAGQ